MKIIAGKKYRATETYPGGLVITYEGIAINNADSEDDGATVTFEDDQEAWASDVGNIKVTVEVINDPLPTTPGSLIRYYPTGREHPDISVVQMRVLTERKAIWEAGQQLKHVELNWITALGTKVSDPITDYDVIYNAEEQS